jgi:hypothetical protein
MPLTIEDQQAVGAQQSEGLRVGLAGPQYIAIAREDLANELRIEDAYNLTETDDPEGEHLLALKTCKTEPQERIHPEQRPQRLHDRRQPNAPRHP